MSPLPQIKQPTRHPGARETDLSGTAMPPRFAIGRCTRRASKVPNREAAEDSDRHRWRWGDEHVIGIRYRQLQRALAAWRRSARDLDLEGCLEVLRQILA